MDVYSKNIDLSLKVNGSNLVFIFGIMQRSGTNYLDLLLNMHPRCRAGGVIHEDFLLFHTDLLTDYVNLTHKHWSKKWDVDSKVGGKDILRMYLGDALARFLKSQCEQGDESLLTTRTPSVKNLNNFFSFFGESKALIIVRDGRDVIESGVRSFGWDYEEAMCAWAKAANVIVEFQSRYHGTNKMMVVRYEDLFFEQEKTLVKIFGFLGLDVRQYDFKKANDLPVKGSSETVNKNSNLHWNKIDKAEDFNPINRWNKWPRSRMDRYEYLVGRQAASLGYRVESNIKNIFMFKVRNVFLDMVLYVKRRIRWRLSAR